MSLIRVGGQVACILLLAKLSAATVHVGLLKLLLLLAIGLGGVYLLNNGLGNGSGGGGGGGLGSILLNHFNRPKRQLAYLPETGKFENQGALLSEALATDPKGCARMLSCWAAARGVRASDRETRLLAVVRKLLLRSNTPDRARYEFLEAIKKGHQVSDPKICLSLYNKCSFSPEQIWKFIA